MTWTVSEVIPPLCSSLMKGVRPPENILDDGEYLSPENRHVKKFTEAKNYPVICAHRITWDKMEVKNVSS